MNRYVHLLVRRKQRLRNDPVFYARQVPSRKQENNWSGREETGDAIVSITNNFRSKQSAVCEEKYITNPNCVYFHEVIPCHNYRFNYFDSQIVMDRNNPQHCTEFSQLRPFYFWNIRIPSRDNLSGRLKKESKKGNSQILFLRFLLSWRGALTPFPN